MWPERRGLLPRDFARSPYRLCVLDLSPALARRRRGAGSPGDLADAVTALRLATSPPFPPPSPSLRSARLSPLGIRPFLPIASTLASVGSTRLDPFRASVAVQLLPLARPRRRRHRTRRRTRPLVARALPGLPVPRRALPPALRPRSATRRNPGRPHALPPPPRETAAQNAPTLVAAPASRRSTSSSACSSAVLLHGNPRRISCASFVPGPARPAPQPAGVAALRAQLTHTVLVLSSMEEARSVLARPRRSRRSTAPARRRPRSSPAAPARPLGLVVGALRARTPRLNAAVSSCAAGSRCDSPGVTLAQAGDYVISATLSPRLGGACATSGARPLAPTSA